MSNRRFTAAVIHHPAVLYIVALLIYTAISSLYVQDLIVNKAGPDFIAYYRNAVYWSQLQFSHAVNGWWGPLFSILIIPAVYFSEEPAVAGWAGVFISGVIFITASIDFFRVCGHQEKYVWFGAITVALFAPGQAAQIISPDLLLSGLFIWGCSCLIRSYKYESVYWAVVAGLIFGLCYLSKTPGLLFGIGAIAVMGVTLGLLTREVAWHNVRRNTIKAGLGLGVIAIPWMISLSAHYGEFTWTTVAKSAYEMTADGEQHENLIRFHVPRQGRVTSWENPTEIDSATKAPLVNGSSPVVDRGIVRALIIFKTNYGLITRFLISPGWFSLVLAGLLAVFLHRGAPQFLSAPWRIGALLAAVIIAPYLVTYAKHMRYFVACFPLLLGCTLGLLNWSEQHHLLSWTSDTKFISKVPVFLLLAVFAGILWIPSASEVLWVVQRDNSQAQYALGRRIARELVQQGISVQSMAAVGQYGRIGLYTAFHLGVPHYGHEEGADNVEFLQEEGVDILLSTKRFETSELHLVYIPTVRILDGMDIYIYRIVDN